MLEAIPFIKERFVLKRNSMKLADCVLEGDKQLCLIMVAGDVALIINLLSILMLVLNLRNACFKSILGEFVFSLFFSRVSLCPL